MDSGNSATVQPSAAGDAGGDGGDANRSTYFNPVQNLQSPSNFFDPSSFSPPLNVNPNPNPNPNSIYNLDSIWSRNPNSDPIYNQDPYVNPNPVDLPAKTPKKRTRASRRAPTTVLTTDTTNFRQMVQEFTGIPTAPFATSSSPSLFGRRSEMYGGGGPLVHPLRPSAMKIQLQQPSYLNSTTTTTMTSSFHLPPSETQGLSKQPLNLSNLQNQMFSLRSVSQSSVQQQVNVTEHQDAFLGSASTSLKRWRGQDENLVNFEGWNGNSQNGVVSLRNDGDHTDQLTGNEDTWICPSD